MKPRSTARWRRCAAALAAAMSIQGLLADGVRAEVVSWEIDETQSELRLSPGFPFFATVGGVGGGSIDLFLGLRSGGGEDTWTVGATASLDGQIVTDFIDGVSIEFLAAQHSIVVLESGSYRPDPAAFDPLLIDDDNPSGQYVGTATAPSSFGAEVFLLTQPPSLPTTTLGFIAFRQVEVEIASGPLAVTGGGFASDELTVGLAVVGLDFDGVDAGGFLGQVLSDAVGVIEAGVVADPNALAGATITTPDPVGAPLVRQLTLPLEFIVDTPRGLVGQGAGQIIAVLELAPDPPAVPALSTSSRVAVACVLAMLGAAAALRWRTTS